MLVGMNQFVEKSIKQFWKLWTGECLGLSREQHSYVKNKNHLERDMICVGDILFVSEKTPRIKKDQRCMCSNKKQGLSRYHRKTNQKAL